MYIRIRDGTYTYMVYVLFLWEITGAAGLLSDMHHGKILIYMMRKMFIQKLC